MGKRVISIALITALCVSAALTGAGCKAKEPASGTVDAAKYEMNLTLDTEKNRLAGEVAMHLKNSSDRELDEVCIRNYAASILKESKKGENTIESIEDGEGNQLSFKHRKDPSVVYVKLGQEKLMPGEEMTLKLQYRTDIPKTSQRFGYRQEGGDKLYLLSFCFPQLAMYEDGKWNENPYIEGGESTYNAVSDFEVTLQTDKDYVVAACGEEETKADGGSAVTSIKGEDIREMAMAVSNYMKVETDTVKGIEVNHYALDYDNAETYNRLTLESAKDSMALFTEKFGEYPHKEIDVVQCFIQGGMEYPGMIYIGLPDMAPESYADEIDENGNFTYLCPLVAHEVCHQWFYGAVGSDQYEEPWLDESFAEFGELLYSLEKPDSLKEAIKEVKALYGEDEVTLWWDSEEEIETFKLVEESNVSEDKTVINKPVDWYEDDGDYSWMVYENGALFLYELKKVMGEEVFYRAMQEYYSAYTLKIAKGRDFLDIIEKHDSSEAVDKVIEKYMEL